MKTIDRQDLFKSELPNLLRLAKFLSLTIREIKPKETDKQYKAHIILQIQRAENLLARKPKLKMYHI